MVVHSEHPSATPAPPVQDCTSSPPLPADGLAAIQRDMALDDLTSPFQSGTQTALRKGLTALLGRAAEYERLWALHAALTLDYDELDTSCDPAEHGYASADRYRLDAMSARLGGLERTLDRLHDRLTLA